MTDVTDRAFFRSNPGANYRLREPAPGEVRELSDAMLPKGGTWAGGFKQPEPAPDWRVLAIRLPLGKIARLLTVSSADSHPAPGEVRFATTVALGSRLAIN